MFILLHFPGRLICAEGSTKVLKEWSKPKTAPGWIRGICSHKLAMRILMKRPWSMSASGINTDGKISNSFNMTIDASLCILPLTSWFPQCCYWSGHLISGPNLFVSLSFVWHCGYFGKWEELERQLKRHHVKKDTDHFKKEKKISTEKYPSNEKIERHRKNK